MVLILNVRRKQVQYFFYIVAFEITKKYYNIQKTRTIFKNVSINYSVLIAILNTSRIWLVKYKYTKTF